MIASTTNQIVREPGQFRRHCCIERRHHHGAGDLPVDCRTERSSGRHVRLKTGSCWRSGSGGHRPAGRFAESCACHRSTQQCRFIYLAAVIDCYSKKVVGWSIADHMRTELVADALRNASATTRIEAGAVFHSDRGSVVYNSAGYRELVADLGMRSSMGRIGVGQRDGRIVLLSVEERACSPHGLRSQGACTA